MYQIVLHIIIIKLLYIISLDYDITIIYIYKYLCKYPLDVTWMSSGHWLEYLMNIYKIYLVLRTFGYVERVCLLRLFIRYIHGFFNGFSNYREYRMHI